MKDQGYLFGVDLAQSTDRTVIMVGQLFQVDEGPKEVLHLHVRHLEILPQHQSYTDQVERIVALKLSSPIHELASAPMVVDATGVGRPVIDLMRERNLNPTPVTFTGGDRSSFDDELRGHRVPKQTLISSLRMLLERGRLKFSKALPDLEVLLDEMQNFELQLTPSGNLTFNARRGGHDDTVAALALMSWWTLEHGPVNWSRDSYQGVKRRAAGFTRPKGSGSIWGSRESKRGRW